MSRINFFAEIRKVNAGSINITIENIKKIFQDMFKQHQVAITKKHEEMFRNPEKSIIQLISGITTLTNQRFDNLSNDNAGLRESLEITQEEIEQKFKKNWAGTLVTCD